MRLALLTTVGLLLSPAVPASTLPAPASAPPAPAGAAPVDSGTAGQPRPVLRLPLDGSAVITRPFDAPDVPYAPGHRGVDLAGVPGQVVRAATAGVVVFAGSLAGRGVVSIDIGAGLRTTYEPVHATVGMGRRVLAGEPIGTLQAGHPGCPAAACLHWGLRRGGEYLDPLGLLGPRRVRLLPCCQ